MSICPKSKPKREKPVELAFRTCPSSIVLRSLIFSDPHAHAAFWSWVPRVPTFCSSHNVKRCQGDLSCQCSDGQGKLKRLIIKNIRMAMCWFRFSYLLWPFEISILIFSTHLWLECEHVRPFGRGMLYGKNKQKTKKYLGTESFSSNLLYHLSLSTFFHLKEKILGTIPYLHSFSDLQFRFMLSFAWMPAMTPNWAPSLQSNMYPVISLIMMFLWQPKSTRLRLQCGIKNTSLLRTNTSFQHHTCF